MKITIKFLSVTFAVLLIISCNSNNESNKSIAENSLLADTSTQDFNNFLSNFTELDIRQYNSLTDIFNNEFLAKDENLIQIPDSLTSKYLPNIEFNYVYYGFKTFLPNKSIILIYYLRHYSDESSHTDTTFFKACFYNSNGRLFNSLNITGSNLSEADPTFNLVSKFNLLNNSLSITTYSYNIPEDYTQNGKFNDEDSIWFGNVIMHKYILDYNTNNIKLLEKTKKKAKILSTGENPVPSYLKLLEPEIE